MTDIIQAYWNAFRAALPEDSRPAADAYEAWPFGDSEAMADELSALVREGIKTATASLLWEYEYEGSPLPQVGAYSIILDGRGRPQCIIRTTEVIISPFNEFNAAFAYDEGEGDRTLAFRRRAHWDFFTRACAVIGRTPEETMPIVGERFERVTASSV